MGQHRSNRSAVIFMGGEEGEQSSLTSVNILEKSFARSTNQGFDAANTPIRDSYWEMVDLVPGRQ